MFPQNNLARKELMRIPILVRPNLSTEMIPSKLQLEQYQYHFIHVSATFFKIILFKSMQLFWRSWLTDTCGSGHGGAAVLLSDFAINW